MKFIAGILVSLLGLFAISSCNSGSSSASTEDSTASTSVDSTAANTGSTAGFKLGVQMWTFRMFPFTEALNKVDSARIKYIEEQFVGDDDNDPK